MPDFDNSFFNGYSDHTIGISAAIFAISRVAGWHAKAYRDAMQHIECEFIDERPEDLEIDDWLELAQLLEDAREAMG